MCKVEGCEKTALYRGMCNGHYRRWTKGKPLEGPWAPGGRPRKPETQRAMEVLADGEWHDYNRLIVAMTKVIPPNVAVAHMQLWSTSVLNERRKREAQGRSREARRRLHTQEQMLRSARRDIAWRRLYTLWRDGRIEINPPPIRGRGDEHYSAIRNRKVRLCSGDQQGRTVDTSDVDTAQ